MTEARAQTRAFPKRSNFGGLTCRGKRRGGFGGLGGGGCGDFSGSMGNSFNSFDQDAHRPFAERRLWNIGPLAVSLRLDAGELDHLAPLLGFLGDQLAEVGGRARKHRAAKIGKPRP